MHHTNLGKGYLIAVDGSVLSPNTLTHIVPPHTVPLQFVQTHDYFCCASCHLPILGQRILHTQERTMYHISCFHLTALPPDTLTSSYIHRPSPAMYRDSKVLFLSPLHHPNNEVDDFLFPTTMSILEVVQRYSNHLRLAHSSIKVNGIPARVHIASCSTLAQLPHIVVLSHCATHPAPPPWPWPPDKVQVVCLPHYSTPYCSRPRVFRLDSRTPIHELPTQFASHTWCDPTTGLHIFWLTMFGTIKPAADVPLHLTLSDFGPHIILFERDSAVPFPSPKLQKILRHTFLDHAPIRSTLVQHCDSLPPTFEPSLYDNGPIIFTQHVATFCLQDAHHRSAHQSRASAIQQLHTIRMGS